MLLDTSGLLPLVLPDAPQHKLALEIYAAATERTIHTFVLPSLLRLPRRGALDAGRYLILCTIWKIVPRFMLSLNPKETNKVHFSSVYSNFAQIKESK